MSTIIRQEDPAYFKIVGTVLTFSDALVAQLAASGAGAGGRQVWTPPLLVTSTTLPAVVALIPWVVTDNATSIEKALHLRAVLQTTNAGITASLKVSSTNTGQDLTIYGPSNVFSSNSTTPVVVESNLDIFDTTPTNVFDPTVDDLLVVTLSAGGDGAVKCKFVELLLVAP